ncbi:LPD29 domain-containing protein [Cytobacillus gottheilii]|uniref:LPD29 domain-containing protein n=1 Tax=Cytobacillus gottheilii TaxID=859144 RepID=UPI0009BC3157|nr:LPD29 domain-containing protein [Cytobacillus gottheilii]
MSVAMKINEELNGIELYFDGKPEAAVRNDLKSHGYRFSSYKSCWYAKQSEKAFKVADKLTNNNVTEIAALVNEKAVKKQVKKETLSLWDATQWEGLEVSQSVKDQDAKEIAKEIRAHVRKRFPNIKFSVRVPYYGRISFDIKSSPFEKGSTYLNAVKTYCVNLLDAYRHCYSAADSYTDYAGSYNFNGWVEICWEYTQTEVTEEVKKDMADFDAKLAVHEQAEEERKEAEFQEYMKQQEIRNAEYKKQQEEEKKQVENIYSSIEVKELEENEQYFVIGSEFADLNKNCTLDQYKEEVEKGAYSLEDVRIEKEIHFNSLEALENFSNMLLNDFDFLANTGGSYTEDTRINSMTDFYNMSDYIRTSVKWFLKGVAIYFNNELQFVVDCQGYDYARYVGLTSNAKIEKSVTVEQVQSQEENTEYKLQADTLADISTSVIDELDIRTTWSTDNWNEYKEAMKDKLKNKLKLTKEIIQQLDIEELKAAMYRLLQEVDGIQDQFTNADIQQGEKLTLIYISDFGSIVTNRITFDSVTNSKYAQYDNAIKLTFTPEKKRKLHYKYFYSTMLVYKGWVSLPKSVLHEEEQRNGFTITKSKYHSCDNRQYDEILYYFEQQDIVPVINTYKPRF